MEDEDSDEEARVLYVAATRPRDLLLVRRGSKPKSRYSESGRVWRWARSGSIQVEIGRPGDVDALGALLARRPGRRCSRMRCREYGGKHGGHWNVSTKKDAGAEGRQWRRLLVPRKDAECFSGTDAYGSLTESCIKDLGSIARAAWGRPTKPPLGFTTLVDRPDKRGGERRGSSPVPVSVPEPWSHDANLARSRGH